jgi:glutathione S-transferase
MKKLPYELVKVDPMAGGTREASFVDRFPAGLIPCIEDGEVRISEAAAIMTYLSSKHGWTDMYPKELPKRALVDQYLHWHHSNTRKITVVFFRPYLFGVLLKNELPRPVPEKDVKLMQVVEWLKLSDDF